MDTRRRSGRIAASAGFRGSLDGVDEGVPVSMGIGRMPTAGSLSFQVATPVYVAGAAAVAAAAVDFARHGHGATTLVGVAALLVATALVERFPVPVPGEHAASVSLAFLFGVSAIVLFGWA